MMRYHPTGLLRLTTRHRLADLREQLQKGLSGSYVIEHELGHFLAVLWHAIPRFG